jgi:DNA-directed RNA polymerase subunit RPC12/RpoP
MGNRFAAGYKAIAECDRCGQQFKLKQLRTEIIKQRKYELLVCPECFDPDHPQLMLGTFPVDDPQALRNPRRDTTYVTSGVNNNGNLSGGSRDIQWGWNPVGGARSFDTFLTPNTLALTVQIGTVTISVS